RPSGPIRTCVVCRERVDPDDLVRLALSPEGHAVVDFRGKLPGRGAWSHPGCLAELEQKPGMLKRSLKIVPPAGPWVADYRAAVERALLDGISQAAAAGALVGGHERLKLAMVDDEVTWVLLASDIAEGTEKKLRAAALERVRFQRVPIASADLGDRVGKGPRAAVGVRPSRATAHLVRQLRRLASLG
ncbi:MAG: DUF448 domain-containing protein, partial [Myxococcales bacterium]|nr:DUF448 domain-containing protein [Myxococcales bacterium]